MLIAALTQKFLDIYSLNINEGNGQTILAQCVKKISELYPKLAKAYVETVAGQVDYSVTVTDLIKVIKVYYSRASGIGDEFVTPPLRGNTLSSQFTDIHEREIFNKLNPVDANITDFNSFEIIPAPATAGVKVYYEYEKYRTLLDIPEIFEDDLFQLFFFYDREDVFKKSMKKNNGNTFNFDRKGNIMAGGTSGSADDPVKLRAEELKVIIKSIKATAMGMKR